MKNKAVIIFLLVSMTALLAVSATAAESENEETIYLPHADMSPEISGLLQAGQWQAAIDKLETAVKVSTSSL